LRSATICKAFTFDAAHQLPNHDGKCRFLHGHTYRVELELHAPVREPDGHSDEGMVVDFAEVKRAWKPLRDRLDHSFLNDVIPGDYRPTTAENIAHFILDRLSNELPAPLSVRVWETPTSMVEVGR
jgi:6-pyruvoyltetrahydropterin/6-carboxytetrahydropterin synthase